MGLWETEADVEASATWNQAQLAKFAARFTSPPQVEQYEVAVEVPPETDPLLHGSAGGAQAG